MYSATDLYHVLTISSDSKENSHKVLMNNIRMFDLEVRRNVPGDGNCLFAAVCDQLQRVHRRKRHLTLRKEVVDFMMSHPCTVGEYNFYATVVFICICVCFSLMAATYSALLHPLSLGRHTSQIWLNQGHGEHI